MPANANDYRGKAWPDVCYDDDEAHFFAVGDWGGVCSFDEQQGNKCDSHSNPYKIDTYNTTGKPYPMPTRAGTITIDVDMVAQSLVADRMKDKAQELKQLGKEPKFVVNVGDNFYPGGIDAHCDNGLPHETSFISSQFAQVFESMYPTEGIGNIEWWSVLGNHDYGGVCYIKGWDQQIFYTFKPDGRWVLPAAYWRRKVQFKTFSVDFFFLDTNIADTEAPSSDPNHNLCSSVGNPGPKCEKQKYPPANGSDPQSCAATGPSTPHDCVQWFQKLWSDQLVWFKQGLQQSTADWQIVVMHHPPYYSPAGLSWPELAREMGIDLIITGHRHEQRVYYQKKEGSLDMEDTAWVITGGGGGINSENLPLANGMDDQYGFMDMAISLDRIDITAISHGGTRGDYIERSKTSVPPRSKPEVLELSV